MVREERADEEHIYRQARRAGHERHHEHRQHAVFGILDIPRRHDSRYVTAETHEHRHETAAVQADPVHDGIHDIRLAGHITRVLHKGDKEKQDDDVRQECQHRADARQHTVYQ